MVLAFVVAAIAITVIRIPARMLGERLHASGVRDQSKWRRDLGAAIYAHSLRLTVALVLLFFVVVPHSIFGIT